MYVSIWLDRAGDGWDDARWVVSLEDYGSETLATYHRSKKELAVTRGEMEAKVRGVEWSGGWKNGEARARPSGGAGWSTSSWCWPWRGSSWRRAYETN